ncbi:TIR domain-containing protein [Flagellimonas sp. DF-77]|uniref:SEFIR domain-containing protein n=1 Tax=Flagellimonas algarum TaxID=3230298 RepID=UPI003392693D
MIENFIHFIKKYCQVVSLDIDKTEAQANRDRLQIAVLKLYYGLDGKTRSVKEISLLKDISGQSVRTRRSDALKTIKSLLESDEQKDIYEYRKDQVDEFVQELRLKKVLSLTELKSIILHKYETSYEENEGYFNLIFDVYGFTIRRPITHYLSENTFLVCDENIDVNEFIDIAYNVYIEIESNIIPIEDDDLIIGIRSKQSKIKGDQIILAANTIDEVESFDSHGKKYFQIKFHKLSAATDMAYRILFNNGSKMKLTEILKEINHALVNTPRKRITKLSLNNQMNSVDKFTPLGRTGVWTLTEWGEENLSIFDLITNVLNHFNEPLFRQKIIDHIRKDRPFIPAKSIDACLYNKRFIQLDNNKFILSDWKDLYKEKITKKKKSSRSQRDNMVKDQIKKAALNMFNENNLTQIHLSIIANKLNKDFDYPKASIYKCISENPEFQTIETKSNKKIVTMKLSKESEEQPTKATSVFVSYSWESEEYKEKVISFTNFLRQKGFMADMDVKLMQEESATDFNQLMHEGILKRDKVIVLLSETYKKKAENFEGGVGKEYSYIIKDIKKNPSKYIFASFEDVNTALIEKIAPIEFSSRHIVSLKKDENKNFMELISKLTDAKQYVFSDVASSTPITEQREIKPFTLK